MTTPQLENGYLRIANELFDAIILFDFSKREILVLFCIIRKTYGYGKKWDEISLSQIAKMTGLKVPHISTAITSLVAKRVLLKQEGKHANALSVNKNYGQWGVTETGTLPKQSLGVTETVKNPLPKRETQKTTQKTIPKDKIDLFPEFYAAYPKKVAKPVAEKAFKRLCETDKKAAIAALASWGFSSEKRFVPNPATWINQRRWEDEASQAERDDETEQYL